MAIQTLNLGTFNNGLGVVDITYDDVSGKAQQLLLTDNGLTDTLTLTAYQPDGVTVIKSWTGTIKNGVTTYNIPQSGANSITLIHTAKGYWVMPFPYGIQD